MRFSIWCQWCLGHLSTPDLIIFFQAAKKALKSSAPDALIIVKENLCPDQPKDGLKGSVVFDDEDSSLTRYFGLFPVPEGEEGLTRVA